jgi:hypothetical protein
MSAAVRSARCTCAPVKSAMRRSAFLAGAERRFVLATGYWVSGARQNAHCGFIVCKLLARCAPWRRMAWVLTAVLHCRSVRCRS